ncbi:molybdenum cofactor biosynthesis protein MoaE [Rhodopirellula sp. MGV]|uniref:molybdenum cofactor biosynthesis protein MoaE n=1 Tax=Rhodopirellula sp. MGV TaxID=2023130 RepID=UPI000B968202|nr:molybdenum cofactor biosynthesis protein MoaE [Rhodopirellula sp. MGV]OYP35250.1 molybdopterin converting factor [Rhodopirellula sp. MGV]PNY37833.1 molybdopterin converting factor [Rhodopirellula baltica]
MDADGVITIRLVHAPIELAQWSDAIGDPDVGSHGWFAGVTRRKTKDDAGVIRITKTLYYEAHQSMARQQLLRIATEAKQRFNLFNVVIVHRLGNVPIGEASVLVGCSSAHRRETFAALPMIMDQLKADVPIWKRETYQDESSEWIHP